MVDEKIKQIKNHFIYDLSKDPRQSSISLLSGRAGTVMYLSEMYTATGEFLYKEHIALNLQLIMEKLEQSQHLASTFCDGLAGLGWLLEYLKKENLLNDEYDEMLGDIDDILGEQADELIANKNFDLLHGLLGIGLYFIKRQKTANAEKILLALSGITVEDQEETKFIRSDPARFKEDVFDFGLPHGIAGVLYFVRRCYESGVRRSLCSKIMQGGIRFYLNNVQDPNLYGSYFPGTCSAANYLKGIKEPSPSRLAWCYGDLIVLYTLFRHTQIFGMEKEAAMILPMLEKIAARRHPVLTNITDATFCHGTTGVGYMFLKLYRQTGSEIFNDAAQFWLNETIALGDREGGFAGYLFGVSNWEKPKFEPSSGVLEGIAGIGLILPSFRYGKSFTHWDESLFLN